MTVVRLLLLLALACLPSLPAAATCLAPHRACLAAAADAARACHATCRRHPAPGCDTACDDTRRDARSTCATVAAPCAAVCGSGVPVDACVAQVRSCRTAASRDYRSCAQTCRRLDVASRPVCRDRCLATRATAERGCGYTVARAVPGAATLPDRPRGRAADLSSLEPAEIAAITAADARAATLRSRRVRVAVGTPGAVVRVVQTHHGFQFGFPVDLARFPTPDDRDWYARTMADHFGLVVIENSLKWRALENDEGVRTYARADADVAWAEGLGLPVKGHAAMWGIVPPFSSSGVPPWALARWAQPTLSPAEQAALREALRGHVLDVVGRYRGRLSIWDATNETLQPFAQWFIERLGPGVVDDVFRWAHEADPEARLVFNEWIVEVFTGFPEPTAAMVRDRVRALVAAGVPVHAIGQQAHFVPGVAFAGLPADLSQRTHIDDYATALDTLAEAGLPLHMTETNFIAPDDPERRAAQAEGILRLWWGHPAVEQIVFWGPWNTVAGRKVFDVGFWDESRTLSRHGEAVMSLLNDRWRTDVTAVADADGVVELVATHGTYAVEWATGGATVHGVVQVVPGTGTATLAVLAP